jgi:hypothetical protein
VHLPVFAEKAAIGVDDSSGVVIEPFRPLLEQRCDDHHAKLSRKASQRLGRRPRHRLRQSEKRVIFRLAEVRAQEQLLKTDDLSAPFRGVPDSLYRLLHIHLGLIGAAHLHQP